MYKTKINIVRQGVHIFNFHNDQSCFAKCSMIFKLICLSYFTHNVYDRKNDKTKTI